MVMLFSLLTQMCVYKAVKELKETTGSLQTPRQRQSSGVVKQRRKKQKKQIGMAV